MGEWDDERASVTGRQITSNIPPKVFRIPERERKRLLTFAVIVPAAVALPFLLAWLLRG